MAKVLRRILWECLVVSAVLALGQCVALEPGLRDGASTADRAMAAFDGAFLTGVAGMANYRASTLGGWADFWKEAEMIEMVEDACQRSPSPRLSQADHRADAGFLMRFGTDWSANAYNDDIIWMCIACARAYELTGTVGFRDQARANFDRVWSRGYDTTLGGGLWWNTSRGEKNTCINMPAAIAAYKLSVDLGDPAYLEKARALYAWEKENLFDAVIRPGF